MSQTTTSSTTVAASTDVSPKREHLLIVNGKEADDATYNRVMNAKAKPLGKARCCQPRPFSLLR